MVWYEWRNYWTFGHVPLSHDCGKPKDHDFSKFTHCFFLRIVYHLESRWFLPPSSVAICKGIWYFTNTWELTHLRPPGGIIPKSWSRLVGKTRGICAKKPEALLNDQRLILRGVEARRLDLDFDGRHRRRLIRRVRSTVPKKWVHFERISNSGVSNTCMQSYSLSLSLYIYIYSYMCIDLFETLILYII